MRATQAKVVSRFLTHPLAWRLMALCALAAVAFVIAQQVSWAVPHDPSTNVPQDPGYQPRDPAMPRQGQPSGQALVPGQTRGYYNSKTGISKVFYPDGTETWYYPDGASCTQGNGNSRVTLPNGARIEMPCQDYKPQPR